MTFWGILIVHQQATVALGEGCLWHCQHMSCRSPVRQWVPDVHQTAVYAVHTMVRVAAKLTEGEHQKMHEQTSNKGDVNYVSSDFVIVSAVLQVECSNRCCDVT